ncbi:ComEC/Rec2 family competence protein [Elizabethkingia anophelis]|uniref:ComEC/Rec2 family competence protein n=1 Tax=Elizabethkingia anophelis TaxID=1117645 RepID=UPI001D5D9C53|nr:MBL fold metallo-hydrolase [Elizabethkingia anophelis]EHM7983046.1 MBL fold metallo-hydrolase [Elizabethkingia anophelis]EHM8030268.1 MBL fold metallo-hydrolase [Elizabethkingia anophelis]EHZ9533022.1 MBL fold metallo-hydrolase [Elizabethkingia anophelis]EKU3670932.1 MBL fold metallo-hydrolase [Elizabethkingia anophelis]EKW9476301.1 MBL fold metallo-hydrolase [Elizabethkingia anophelis]
MEIKFLKAGSGDCIIIHNETKNILIDGGNESNYLIDQYQEIINKNEIIDLLIITHHDDDHIKGILDLFNFIEKKNERPKINTIIFNSPRKINNSLTKNEESKHLSYKQAFELEKILLKNGDITWLTSLECDSDEVFKDTFGELDLKIFSPSKEILKKYSLHKDAYLNGANRCDWNTSLKELGKLLDDKSQDSSSSNRTSIVVSITFNGKKILLTADVTPERFNDIIDQIRGTQEKVHFDLIKLPHHGSYKSLNSKILQKIICFDYLISTNSSKYFLPNKRTIIKILKNNTSKKTINFLFNYEETIYKLNITSKELSDNKIQLKQNTHNWGYGINF